MAKKVKIGKSNLEIVPFSLGCNVFGWTADEKTSFDILDAYTDAGFDFIDTADVYSVWAPGNKGGESETIIGNWLKKTGKRNQIVISTKVGAPISDTHRGLKKEYILKEVEESLKRLKTDHIDLYFTHFDDLSTPVAETLEAYAQLVKDGKVRYIAASNMSDQRIRESMKYSRENNLPEYVCLEPEYNLYNRQQYETEYAPLSEEFGLGVIAYFSLASGFLTGKYKSIDDTANSARKDRLTAYFDDRGQRILQALHDVAKEYDATSAQIALAWLLAQPTVTAPIASVSKPQQFDILKCVDIELKKDAINKLNDASAY